MSAHGTGTLLARPARPASHASPAAVAAAPPAAGLPRCLQPQEPASAGLGVTEWLPLPLPAAVWAAPQVATAGPPAGPGAGSGAGSDATPLLDVDVVVWLHGHGLVRLALADGTHRGATAHQSLPPAGVTANARSVLVRHDRQPAMLALTP